MAAPTTAVPNISKLGLSDAEFANIQKAQATVNKSATTPALTTTTGVDALGAVTDLSGANSAINSGQQKDFADATKSGEPPVRSSAANITDMYDAITKTVTKDLPDKPATPNLTETYNNLRTSQGVTDLETQLQGLQKQARDINALNQVQYDAETGKPVAINVIEGRVSEEQKQNNQKLTAINNSIATITGQLQTKYNTIDSIMKYTGQDYSNASDAYDKTFSQNLSLINTVKGIADSQKSAQETAQDDARANLQIIYNNLNSGAANASSLTPAEKTNITKLEMQAGLPQGFYTSITSKNPKSDILSTTTREADGTKYADVILRNQDGSLSTKTITLGASKTGTDNMTTAEQLQTARATVFPQLKAKVGSDGHISNQDFNTAKDAWLSSGLAADDFDTAFKQFVDPTHLKDYNIDQTIFYK